MTLKIDDALSKTEAVVLATDGDTVKIKLLGKDEKIVHFPIVLFPNPEDIKFGKHLLYEIKLDTNGYRYQQFTPQEQVEVKKDDQLEKILADIDEARIRGES